MSPRIERRQNKRPTVSRRRGARPQRKPVQWGQKVLAVARYSSVTLTLLAVVWGGYSAWHWFDTLPVERVVFTGELRQTHRDRLIEVVQPGLRDGFFGIELDEIQRELEAELWVYRATVARVWPLQLRVNIVEQRPIARWGREALINHMGEKFPMVVPGADQLPLLSGPEGSERQLIDAYQMLQRRLQTVNATPTALSRDRLGNWQVQLAGGQQLVLAAQDLGGTLDRFIEMYGELLATRFDDVARIDLRYANGIAIAWRQQSVAGIAAQQQGDFAR